jgi:endogenous inhibitor of DNA gyrase (YacG/DUF329 family)
MIRGKCPICRSSFESESLAALPFFPFCSERCKLVDLGRWLDGQYVIPGKDIAPKSPGVNMESSDEGDE